MSEQAQVEAVRFSLRLRLRFRYRFMCRHWRRRRHRHRHTANLRTKILDFRGFDSSRILILRGEIPRSIGQLPGDFESTDLSRENLST